MPDKFLTLLDMTKRAGGDMAVGLVDEVNTVAPELTQLSGRPINGINYKIKKRTALPGAGRTVFRHANEGSDAVASTYEEVQGSCFFADVPLIVDEAVIKSGKTEGAEMSEVLSDEASGAFQQAVITIGDQFYRGKTADSKGFIGIQDLYDPTTCEVSAGGSSGSATSAWLIWNDPQGLHWVWGNNMGLSVGDWNRQALKDANGKTYFGYVNNVNGYIGLSIGHKSSIGRVKLITSTFPLTDAIGHELIAKLPIFMRRQSGLRWLMNSQALLLLQKSRSVVNLGTRDTTNGDKLNRLGAGTMQFAPTPTELAGVPIILTDSIPNNE